MNLQKLTKNQLVEMVEQYQEQTKVLSDQLNDVSLQHKWETFVHELKLLVIDLGKVTGYVYNLGFSTGLRLKTLLPKPNEPTH